jgi:N-acetylneuraminic acid mutarotase
VSTGGIQDAGNAPGDSGANADGGALVQEGWRRLPDLIRGSRQEIGVAALGGEIYVVGGYHEDENNILSQVPWADAYDPTSQTWRSLADLPATLHHVNLAALGDRLYVVGSLVGGGFNADGRVFSYDPACDEWTEKASMPAGSARGGSGVTVLNDRIFVAGGYRSGAVADFSAYDPDADSWETLPPLPQARDHGVAGAIGGRIIIAGGRSGGIYGHTADVFSFDPNTNSFSPRAPMPTSRAGSAAAVFHDRLFVFGGEGDAQDPDGVFDEVEAYDPVADLWQVHPALPTKRHGMGAAVLGDVIFVPGGASIAAFAPLAVMEAYTPPP